MVKSPAEYRWSSAAAHLGVGPDRSGLLDMDYWHKAGGPETWRDLHDAPANPDRVTLLRKCTYAGRPFSGSNDPGVDGDSKSALRQRQMDKAQPTGPTKVSASSN
jgi:hypothetical protein